MNNYTIVGNQSENPTVSIAMLTYNHEDYIKKAVESVLIQKTNFSIQLVIAEDCSTDRTREIVLNYQKKNPKKIKLILQHKNVGAAVNNQDLFANLDGNYIAALEGDDYWIDPLKLQKQVDFMEENPEFSVIFHQVQILEDNVLGKIYPKENEVNTVTTIEDLSVYNYIPTLSVLYKNPHNYPDYFIHSPMGDYPLHLYNAEKGKIKFIPEVMGIYRKGVGIWSSQDSLKRTKNTIISLSLIQNHYKTKKIVHNNITKLKNGYLYYYAKVKNNNKGIFHFITELQKNDLFNQIPIQTKIIFCIKYLLKK